MTDASTSAADDPPPLTARQLFANRPFAVYWVSRFLATFAAQIISVAVGWQVYDITRDPLDLGIIGLVQFLPSLLLVLVTGAVADHFDRRVIFAICLAAEAACAAALLFIAVAHPTSAWPIFGVLIAFGTARAFIGPAVQAMLPNLVPRHALATAIAWNTSSWQTATIGGPVVGGLLYGLSASAAYGTAAVLLAIALAGALMLPKMERLTAREPTSLATVVAGFRYVWHNKIVLGAISLDLFAVLLGGATALLPAYARDILEVGPWGLGMLRAAPGIGAIAVATYLANAPIRDHAGAIMFVAVALFGVATAGFGASTIAWVSVALLALMGGADMISVYVRETLIQLATPDAVRGRVNAVNMVFIGASNELGEFRAGTMAALIGVVSAVVFGGVGTVVVAVLWAWWFPQLRQARKLDGH